MKQICISLLSLYGGEKLYLFNTTYNQRFYFDIWDRSSRQLLFRTDVSTDIPYGFSGDFWANYELPKIGKRLISIPHVDEETIYAVIEARDAAEFLDGVRADDNPVIMVAKLKPTANDPSVRK